MAEIKDIRQVAVSELIPYINNAKQHSDDQVARIASSIREFGFLTPVLIDGENNIIAGHGRIMAAKKLGLEKVPCVNIEGLSEAQRKAYILADNRLTELGGWDMDLVSSELMYLDELGFDIDLTGFELDLEEPEEVVEDEFDGELPEEPKAKVGDVYQLGRHRLMCGDSTSVTDVDKLMEGAKADLVFTDPPYGMKKEADGVANDNLNYDDLLEFNRKWIPLTFGALKENGSWYCWGIDEPLMDIYSNILKPMMRENKITFRNLITWDKGHGQGQLSQGFRMFPIADEKCLFVMQGVRGFNTNSDNYYEGYEPIRLYLVQEWAKVSNKNNWNELLGNQMGGHYFSKSQWSFPTEENYKKLQTIGENVGAFKRDYNELKREYEEIKQEFNSTRTYFDNTHDNMNNVWHFSKTSGEERKSAGGHATPKPIALCSRAIKSSSREGENILDVFGGSGSTLITCEQLHRNAYLMELDPKWVDVIIDRWESYTGKKAVLLTE